MAAETAKSSLAPAPPIASAVPLLKEREKPWKRHNIMCSGHCFVDQSPIMGRGVCDCGYIG